MVLVTAYNTAVRYIGGYLGFRLSSNLYLELQWYLFSLLFLLAAASALCKGEHVRVDILYSRLSARARAWIDLLGTIVLMIPFSAVTLWLSWPSIRNSWAVREISSDPGWPPALSAQNLHSHLLPAPHRPGHLGDHQEASRPSRPQRWPGTAHPRMMRTALG